MFTQFSNLLFLGRVSLRVSHHFFIFILGDINETELIISTLSITPWVFLSLGNTHAYIWIVLAWFKWFLVIRRLFLRTVYARRRGDAGYFRWKKSLVRACVRLCVCVCLWWDGREMRVINWWLPLQTGLNVQEKGGWHRATWNIDHMFEIHHIADQQKVNWSLTDEKASVGAHVCDLKQQPNIMRERPALLVLLSCGKFSKTQTTPGLEFITQIPCCAWICLIIHVCALLHKQ